MKVWPFEAALRGEASNRHMLRQLNAVRGERCGKGALKGVRWGSGRRTQVNRCWSVVTGLGGIRTGAKPECPGRSLAGARWLARRCPACRRREPDLLLSYGTWEGVPRQLSFAAVQGGRRQGVSRAAETVRDWVPERGVLADRLV